MIPCKHLDYTDKYGPDIALKTCAPDFPEVKYWFRGPSWTDNALAQKPNPAKVQFCGAGRGRINGIFDCYQAPGPMGCYAPNTSNHKGYIGDGVYADYLFNGEIILTTEDGASTTNKIVLGVSEWRTLQDYVKRLEVRLEAADLGEQDSNEA